MIKKIITIMLVVAISTCGTAFGAQSDDFSGDVNMNVHNSKPIVEELSTTSITNYVIQEGKGAIFDIYAMLFDANGIDTMDTINVTVISPTGNVVVDSEIYDSKDKEFSEINITNGEFENTFTIPEGSEAGKYKIIVEMTDKEGKTGSKMIKQTFSDILMYTITDVKFGRVIAGETATTTFNVTNNYGAETGKITDIEFSDVIVYNSLSDNDEIPAENFEIVTHMPIEVALGETVTIEVSCDVPYGTHAALEGVSGSMTVTFEEEE